METLMFKTVDFFASTLLFPMFRCWWYRMEYQMIAIIIKEKKIVKVCALVPWHAIYVGLSKNAKESFDNLSTQLLHLVSRASSTLFTSYVLLCALNYYWSRLSIYFYTRPFTYISIDETSVCLDFYFRLYFIISLFSLTRPSKIWKSIVHEKICLRYITTFFWVVRPWKLVHLVCVSHESSRIIDSLDFHSTRVPLIQIASFPISFLVIQINRTSYYY